MGFTHEELLRSLPAAVKPFRVEKQSALVYWLCPTQPRNAGQRIVLTLKPQTTRTLAAITLPVTAVTLQFFGFSQARREDFMRRYKSHLHKGGG